MMSVDLAITGIQASRLQHKGRSNYRVKSETSYVDETLFGSPSRPGRSVSGFDPPWTAASSQLLIRSQPCQASPRELDTGLRTSPLPVPAKSSPPTCVPKKKKYRLKSHTPSYCDEMLFGSRQEDLGWEAPWTKKKEKVQLRPLLWTPPVSHKVHGQATSHSSPPKGTPMKAVHPDTAGPPSDSFSPDYKEKTDFWKRPRSDLDPSRKSLSRERSHSLTRLSGGSGGPGAAGITAITPRKDWAPCRRPSSAYATLTGLGGDQHRPGSAGLSGTLSAGRPKTTGSIKIKPAWKC
ncbi:RBPJ-interacting and tubulin-associated protein 1 [Latimeria chalumnae]|uniref:RBPJ-interacting and tubulin-associated protein 1 n=1 Tax=Latimeria chalumnae TaxID=7897 RepID=H3AMQ4_LATCH|nr:PREDICTED: RBPJ-interacting and tubulin-associated protein 1 [Latimeria chalumnae]XP_006005492.1 PREDICTED: RBPJ-interacting and tubulin-associated protein 1 [Latimeria chalumnae]XP_006005493.1 PREDICTED: RBPJ-interacting and tubulin-associated protein 1 [Latimeria chalumnae]XP_014349662.1 PREDICTED: RBPJ-interacting and tubulin-associated protein 1 [Latimeria chalumnae]|eukprot:XP_006005490.1 PREDICTED: RBPJ-interacting and tubulin-associated protein 1 [Latimeria chalumnae]